MASHRAASRFEGARLQCRAPLDDGVIEQFEHQAKAASSSSSCARAAGESENACRTSTSSSRSVVGVESVPGGPPRVTLKAVGSGSPGMLNVIDMTGPDRMRRCRGSQHVIYPNPSG